jgi:hypothetical protein
VVDPFEFVVRGDQFWVLQDYRSPRIKHAVRIFTANGVPAGEAFPVEDREREFRQAYIGVLSLSTRDSVLFGHPQAGIWSVSVAFGVHSRRGEEAMPGSRTELERIGERMWRVHSPGGTVAVGDIGQERVGVLYATQLSIPSAGGAGSVASPQRLELTYYVDVFTNAGQYLGSTPPFAGRFVSAAAFARGQPVLFLGFNEPLPHVVAFRIEQLGEGMP